MRPRGHYETIPGIDIERVPGVRGGDYTRKGQARLEASPAPALFDELKQILADAGLPVRDFSARGEGSYNPGVGSGQLACLITVQNVDLVLYVPANTAKSRIWIATTPRAINFGVGRLERMGARQWNSMVRGHRRYMVLPESWTFARGITTENVVAAFETVSALLADAAAKP